jgi:HNH endonuclease
MEAVLAKQATEEIWSDVALAARAGAHHLQHWAKGGETTLENLLLLCRFHNRLLHEGGYTAEQLGDGEVRFRNRFGVAIPSVPRSPPGDPDELRERNRSNGLTIDSQTCRKGTGERMDLAMAVDAVLRIVR